ncbi:MAG: HEAT repeat domain-containing protein, partial [Planctomycetes bacterium]|nr:HEAT repeat domain-containing protein [Planctomycetota bacterium]
PPPHVVRWLVDDHPTVLAAALRAVERLALAGQGEAVLRLLGHADPTVQAAAADAASALGLARARDALLALARGRSEAAPATATAAVVLEHPGARPDDVARTLREVLGLDAAAARALVAAPGAVAASGLPPAAAEACRLRLQAVGARAVVRGGAAADAAAVDASRLAAVRALERLPQAALVEGDPTPLVEALKGRAQADDFVERVARVLGRMVGTERLDLVVGALLGEPHDGPVVAALRVLGRRERREAAPALLGLLTAGSEAVRAAAARALGDLGDPGALAALRGVVDGGGPAASRAAALRAALALLRRAGDAAGGRGLALARVDDAEVEVARAALDDLAEHPAGGQASGEDVAGRLLVALRRRLGLPPSPGAPLDPRALREAWRDRSPALIEALSRAVLAQGDEARAREAADLVFAVVPALTGARALLVRADAARHREGLRALATGPDAAWALPLLAEVDEAAAVVVALGLGPRPGLLPPEAGLAAVRVVARRRLAATDDDERRALDAWLRPALLDARAEARRAARAGLEPGRFPDALAPSLLPGEAP